MHLSKNSIWQKLQNHYREIANTQMMQWFNEDTNRFKNFSVTAPHLFLDYSKNRITSKTIQLLCELANSIDLKSKINAMFQGESVNTVEQRAALHIALRDQSKQPLFLKGKDIKTQIKATLNRMQQLAESIYEQTFRGYSNEPITDIVSIGIGGSSLGPKMVCRALSNYSQGRVACHFASNLDSDQIHGILKKLHPENTLFCIASKSFTTPETLSNSEIAKKWILDNFHSTKAIAKHFIAVSSAAEKATAWGISKENIFEMENWVGGRFSVWSAIGFPIAFLIGMENFQLLLKGAYEMDQHFLSTSFEKNVPVLLALLSIWYRNFFGTSSQAIIPYTQSLLYLPCYLQQVMMESNGKSVDIHGKHVNYSTEPVIWGDVGADSQHSFHQALHQGTDLIPIDFIVALEAIDSENHKALFANCLAQAQVLLRGQTEKEVLASLTKQGLSDDKAQFLAPHKVMPGNRPSNMILLKRIDPQSLGALMAAYEHKAFVEGAIWNINSFDQWGVELGKTLASHIHNLLKNVSDDTTLDSSTRGLMKIYLKNNKILV